MRITIKISSRSLHRYSESEVAALKSTAVKVQHFKLKSFKKDSSKDNNYKLIIRQ